MGSRSAYKCCGASSGCSYRGAHRRLRSRLSHTRPRGLSTPNSPVRIKTHKVCSFHCFEISSAVKMRLGWGSRGCSNSTMTRDPIGDRSIALSQVVEGSG